MKTITKLLCALIMGVGLCTFVTPLKAEKEPKGVVYYYLQKVSGDVSSLPTGMYFLSKQGGDLSDTTYRSAKFPDTFDANLMITGALDTSSDYYGKDDGTYRYGIDGYPVDVLKRDSKFDGCQDGHIFLPTKFLSRDENYNMIETDNTLHQWMYFCNYSGAQNIGPYDLYSIKTAYYGVHDVSVKVLKDFTKMTTPVEVTPNDFEVSIDVGIDGKQEAYQTKDFTIETSSGGTMVDPNKGPFDVTIVLEGVDDYTKLKVNVSIFNEPIKGVVKQEPKQTTPLSPNTSFTMPLVGAIGVSVVAIGTTNLLGKRKHK